VFKFDEKPKNSSLFLETYCLRTPALPINFIKIFLEQKKKKEKNPNLKAS